MSLQHFHTAFKTKRAARWRCNIHNYGLTRRKLFPAIYSLAVRNLVPDELAIVGVSRSEETDADFRARMKDAVREFGRDPIDEKVWKRLAAGMHYVSTDFAADQGEDAA